MLSKSRFSSSFVRWLAIKAKAAYFSFEDPSNFRNRFKVFMVTFWSISITEYLVIHSCYNASLALILSFGSKANNLFTRSMASLEMDCHSSSSVRNLPSFTFFIIYSSFAPLKGGYPHRRMYRITPILHKSHFSS